MGMILLRWMTSTLQSLIGKSISKMFPPGFPRTPGNASIILNRRGNCKTEPAKRIFRKLIPDTYTIRNGTKYPYCKGIGLQEYHSSYGLQARHFYATALRLRTAMAPHTL